MSNNGKYGERMFKQAMLSRNYSVEEVSNNPQYFDKDIDFFVTSSTTGSTKSFEVKWDSKIHKTNKLYLEISNVNSKQWNGEGWWLHCQADYLAYGDSAKRKFYIIPMDKLRERVAQLPVRYAQCSQDSVGQLIYLNEIEDLYQIIERI